MIRVRIISYNHKYKSCIVLFQVYLLQLLVVPLFVGMSMAEKDNDTIILDAALNS